jgi:putative copper export protein
VIDALWLALRAAGFVVWLGTCGGALYLEGFRGQLPEPAAVLLRTRTRRAAFMGLTLVCVQGLFEPARLAGAWDGLQEPSLWRLALVSPVALGLWMRAVGLLALSAGVARRERAWRALAPLGALLVLGAFLVSGHTVTAAHRALLAPLLGLHVAVAAFWFGALQAFRALSGRLAPQALVPLLQRFSVYAVWLVPLLGAAGIGLAVGLLPDAAALRRPYGLLLCLKALLFAGLLGLAALNRARLVPALARGQATAHAALKRTLAAESYLITAVLIATAVLSGQFSPQE